MARASWPVNARFRASAAKHYIVRTSWLFAPHGKNFALSILKAADVKPELRVVADQIGSPTYAKDLAGVSREAGRFAAVWRISLHELGELLLVRVCKRDSERGGQDAK